MFPVARRRLLSLPRLALNVSGEVREALATKSAPVVSLESTIITHGLPYPRNIEMALKVEQTIRDNGAIPATCAFINGAPHVGIGLSQLEQLAESAARGKILKVSRRDIGYTMANGMDGGTTIALTMILSHMAGIKVFATGGLGGVHKDGHRTFDVSADLTELGKTPVAVVCAGPKSILDVALTMEYLETQGVFVGTLNDDGRKNVQVPGFYCRESGVKSPYSFTDLEMAASIIHQQTNAMKLATGSVFCIPPPVESALSSQFIDGIITNAHNDAIREGVSGKELTPFLLGRIAKETNGRSVECNIEFVLNNARCAAQIAAHLLRMELENGVAAGESAASHQPVLTNRDILASNQRASNKADVVVIGLVAVDTLSAIHQKSMVMGDSNPGSIKSSIGGVGFNLNLACEYGLQAEIAASNIRQSSRLVSVVGDDLAGKTVMEEFESLGLDRSGIAVQDKSATAQYASVHGCGGELVVACADMTITETDFSGHAIEQLDRAGPLLVVIDCNLSLSSILRILEHTRAMAPLPQVIIEPTSAVKAARLAQIETGVFPQNAVSLITPTVSELHTIFESYSHQNKFDDLDQWFPVLDSLGINSEFRSKCEALSRKPKCEIIKRLFDRGTMQECFHLLPYFPNILVKLGAEGVVMVSITKNANDYKSIPTTSRFKPNFSVTSLGTSFGPDTQMGVLVQYFGVPEENQNLEVKNVTGAGDSLMGYLASRLAVNKERWLDADLVSVEQEWCKWQDIYEAQLAAGCSLESDKAVSPEIKLLKA